MKVAHFGSYAPTSSGLYESARDFVRADVLAGRDAIFVDVGALFVGTTTRKQPATDAGDDRGGWVLRPHSLKDAEDADVWVFHDGPALAEWARSDCPIVWILHGRPAACHRVEAYSNGKLLSYSHFAGISKEARVKVMATMIEEHMPYWRNVLPREKLRLIQHPPIDPDRFSPDGPKYQWSHVPGKYNVAICDSWREDIDIFDTLNAACIAAENLPGQIKFHIFGGMQERISALEPLLARLRELGALGECHTRVSFIADVYRAVDCVLTPHTIPTRIITEALACGAEVVAGAGCRYTPWRADPSNPDKVADVLIECLTSGPRAHSPADRADAFNLTDFAARMGELYAEALAGVPCTA